jgi:hypothetical protein
MTAFEITRPTNSANTQRSRRAAAALAALSIAATVAAVAGKAPAKALHICLAPATAQMATGNSTDVMGAVRETFTSFLTGPSLSVTPLNARLTTQAREEAKLADCPYVLFPTIRHEHRTGTGLWGRVAAGAVEGGAWHAAAAAPSAATRVLAGAASTGAATMAVSSAIKTKDSMTLEYRLESADGHALIEKKEKRSAGSDGEDLLTPLVQGAAENIVATLSPAAH